MWFWQGRMLLCGCDCLQRNFRLATSWPTSLDTETENSWKWKKNHFDERGGGGYGRSTMWMEWTCAFLEFGSDYLLHTVKNKRKTAGNGAKWNEIKGDELWKRGPSWGFYFFIWIWVVGHSRRYCNTGSTRDEGGASSVAPHPILKISLISMSPLGDVSDIKLIRTDTTLWS